MSKFLIFALTIFSICPSSAFAQNKEAEDSRARDDLIISSSQVAVGSGAAIFGGIGLKKDFRIDAARAEVDATARGLRQTEDAAKSAATLAERRLHLMITAEDQQKALRILNQEIARLSALGNNPALSSTVRAQKLIEAAKMTGEIKKVQSLKVVDLAEITKARESAAEIKGMGIDAFRDRLALTYPEAERGLALKGFHAIALLGGIYLAYDGADRVVMWFGGGDKPQVLESSSASYALAKEVLDSKQRASSEWVDEAPADAASHRE